MQEHEYSGRSLGKWMLLMAWAGFLLLLSSLFYPLVQQKNNPNQKPQTKFGDNYHEVILRAGRHGHYVASGQINGVPVTFLVDTGASHVVIPDALVQKLGLTRGVRYRVDTAAGPISVYATELRTVRIGAIELENVQASINPNRNSDEILLGMSFLRELELIHRADELTLRQYH